MNNSDVLAFAGYVSEVAYTLLFVFEIAGSPDDLIEWLRPMTLDDEGRALLMHEEPLYVAADFLGMDRSAQSFDQYEEKYEKIRSTILYPRRSPGVLQATPSDLTD